jgi:hypothetical protein
MSRDILKVDGVPLETKELLQAAALKLYRKSNASLMVRSLIAEHVKRAKVNTEKTMLWASTPEKTKRLELRLPASIYDELGQKADSRLADRNDYIRSLIYQDLGQPQLLVDEIEVLRSSNYHMAKIGTNLNQIAKAFNLLVQMGGQDKLPELGKKMLSLRREIRGHTNTVLRVLNARTAILKK